MKKIALLFALLAGMFTSAMAEESKDSVWVVQGDTAATAYAISDGDYITFSKPSLWHKVVSDASTYFYYGGAYTWNYKYSTTIQQKGTENLFYIDNFLNSGSGFYFQLENTDGTIPEVVEDPSTFKGYVSFLNGYGVDVTDYGTYKLGYFYTSTAWGWTDAANNVTYDYFGMYSDNYTTFDGASKYVEIMCYVTIGGKNYYTEVYFDWR